MPRRVRESHARAEILSEPTLDRNPAVPGQQNDLSYLRVSEYFEDMFVL